MAVQLNPRHAVYAGSFDPVTLGHVDIIRRGARLFERLTVGVGINPDKQPLFTPEERVHLMADVVADVPNVEVDCFEGLTVDFVRRRGAAVMLRGVRTVSDIESEFTMTLANRALEPRIETIFLMASEKFSHISSTLIKQIARMGQDANAASLREFVPQQVIEPLVAKYRTDVSH
ncbi:MAG: pantetheine-phosphate adenylyltransferase [Planctomycetaceae bacterium]|nr:pantetheine-phosphate adenylyltransferase [Planctomycetaceae bacterium]